MCTQASTSTFPFIKPMRECFDGVPFLQNFMPINWFKQHEHLRDVYALHLCGTNGYNTKPIFMPIMLKIREFADMFRRVFSEEQIKDMFGRHYHASPSVSIFSDEFKAFTHRFMTEILPDYNNNISLLVKYFIKEQESK